MTKRPGVPHCPRGKCRLSSWTMYAKKRALITSDSGATRLPGHQMARLTPDCAPLQDRNRPAGDGRDRLAPGAFLARETPAVQRNALPFSPPVDSLRLLDQSHQSHHSTERFRLFRLTSVPILTAPPGRFADPHGRGGAARPLGRRLLAGRPELAGAGARAETLRCSTAFNRGAGCCF